MLTCLLICFLETGRNLEEERSRHGPHHLHVSHHVGADEDDGDEEGGHDEEGAHLNTHIWTFLKLCHAGNFLEAILLYLVADASVILLLFIVLKKNLQSSENMIATYSQIDSFPTQNFT